MLVAAAAMVIAVNVGDLRWEEFVGGEINPAEQFAGIVAGSDALLLRNTEIVSGNHHLDVPFDLYDGKDTDGGVNDLIGISYCRSFRRTVCKCSREFCSKARSSRFFLRRAWRTDPPAALPARLLSAGLYGILLQLIQRAVGAEYLDVAFAAVKHHVLLNTESPEMVTGGAAGVWKTSRVTSKKKVISTE